jgi:rare lipoprotein A
MRWRRLGLGVALGLAVQACSLTKPVTPPVVGGRQEGVASWYGPGFHGKRTANGEVYDQYELTAAHQTLPLGTRVMVTSLTNGRSVEVRINDRGPFVGGRIVDLSYAAASVIRMVGAGTMPVRLEVLGGGDVLLASRGAVPVGAVRRAAVPSPREIQAPPRDVVAARELAAPEPEPAGSYAVLVATLSDAGKAEHLRSRIAIRFADAHVSPLDAPVGRYYRVRIGPYATRGIAVAQAERVERYGYPAVITDESRP